MIVEVNNTQTNNSTNTAPTAHVAEVNDSILTLKDKMTKALNSASGTVSPQTIKQQLAQNQQFSNQIAQITSQINQLQKSGAPADQIASLQSQVAGLNQLMSALDGTTDAMAFTYLNTLEAPAGTAPPPNSPILVVPLPDVKSHLTVQDQGNLFLAPSLATLIFTIMQKVVKQKIQNIDEYRQFMTQYIANTEQFALNAAQATIMQGENEAASMRAQAIGTLVGAGIQMGLGIASIGLTAARVGTIKSNYDEEIDNLEKTKPSGWQKSIQELNATKQHAISNELQTNYFLKTMQLIEQTAPSMANGIGQIIGAGYKVNSAQAEAAKMLWQAAMQAAQSIVQDLQQGISANAQDISQFLQAVEGIMHSLTTQG